jgi:hypothetical protein
MLILLTRAPLGATLAVAGLTIEKTTIIAA